MTAGRPRTIDTETLYRYAHHFYWELKNLQEGFHRIVVDQQKYQLLMQEVEQTSRLGTESIERLTQGIDRQIELGYLPTAEREHAIQEVRESIEFHRRFAGSNFAMDLSRKPVRVPGEPDVIDELLEANTPDQIKKICADAFMTDDVVDDESGQVIELRKPAWPISSMSALPSSLSKYACEFIGAKNDPRFPKSGRPTSRLKQLWFLSRSLAGAVHGLRTRTAINLIGSVRPDEAADLSKRTRVPRKKARKQT